MKLDKKTRRLKARLYRQKPDGARVDEDPAVETASIQTKPGWCAG